MDMVVRTERHPQPGETVLGQDFKTFPGGKGANQAVAAARAGGRVKMIGRLGTDAFGDRLEAELKHNGVDTTCIQRTPDAASGVALITLDGQGQNTIVVASGANGLLTPQDLRDFTPVFEGASVLLVQLETPLATVSKAMALAKLHGVKVVLNPAPAQPLPGSMLAHVDYLIPGEFFPAALIGGGLLIWAAIRAGIRRKLVIISLAAAVLMLFGSQALAVATGLATGKMEPVGIWWVIVLGMMGVYTLMVIVLGVAGCLLVKDLFQSGKT
jgi:ribokinase